ncbi:uncharacterized protein LOC129587576 [Paramacrobiotus metropolitanus]|uniref:uncharacterized protein LOC129587576 n=1 Tax=Paramacrobiotus metropolitanus TaxID=2943436 RepID=UPI002445E8D2|nr:uncharacterized protein LOC129587576 [Paramacrobiotus metropolitanus]
MSSSDIPVVDFAPYRTGTSQDAVADAIITALRQHTCLYLTNHGVPQQQLDGLMQQSRRFFELPVDVKNQSARAPGYQPSPGYIGQGVESVSEAVAPEVRECFDLMLQSSPPASNVEAVQLTDAMRNLNQSFHNLTLEMFACISRGLHLDAGQRDNIFAAHAHMGDVSRNSTMLRSAWYPAMQPTELDSHTRISPHTDFGTISFIYQDDAGGLEVDPNRGNFIPAAPLPGALLVMAADVFQYWTSAEIKATNHRVVPNRNNYTSPRQSFVFFVDPDYEAPIVPFDLRATRSP